MFDMTIKAEGSKDLYQGLVQARIWITLGKLELKQKYRRSMLGPLWATLSMAIQIAISGFVFSYLFKIDFQKYLPYLCISLITWSFLVNSINEGAVSLINNSSLLLQVNRPYSAYILLVIWRNVIIYFHMLVVYLVVAIIFSVKINLYMLFIPLGLFLLIANISWMVLILAIFSSRFRDIPLIVQNALNFLVWLTPIYYDKNQLGENIKFFLTLNPFTYLIEISRDPFLGRDVEINAWIFSGVFAVFGWTLAVYLFNRYRKKIIFWI
jgi:lipopolysaccharide transport system permease protein